MRGLEKNRMGRGQTNRQTDRRTCRLSDQLGPEGRVGENPLKRYYNILLTSYKSCKNVAVEPKRNIFKDWNPFSASMCQNRIFSRREFTTKNSALTRLAGIELVTIAMSEHHSNQLS